MLGEPKIVEHPVGNAPHLFRRDAVLVIETDRQVIDRLLHDHALSGGRLNERRSKLGIVCAQVAAGGSRDAISLDAGAGGHPLGDVPLADR